MKGWGKRLQEARERRPDLNKADFAQLVGSNRTSWLKFEKEETAPDLEVVIRVMKETGVSLDWIATGVPTTGVLDMSKLRTAIKGTLALVESAGKQGKGYELEEIVSMVVALYDGMVKEALDETGRSGNVPHTEVASGSRPHHGQRDRKAGS